MPKKRLFFLSLAVSAVICALVPLAPARALAEEPAASSLYAQAEVPAEAAAAVEEGSGEGASGEGAAGEGAVGEDAIGEETQWVLSEDGLWYEYDLAGEPTGRTSDVDPYKASLYALDKDYWFYENGTWNLWRVGRPVSGWVEYHGTLLYLREDGSMKTGWQKSDEGYWRYLREASGSLRGSMATGWVKIGSAKYYFESKTSEKGPGRLHTGWLKQGSSYYYFSGATGRMVTGWRKISGKWYYFLPSGVLNRQNLWQGSTFYPVHSDGSWYSAKEFCDRSFSVRPADTIAGIGGFAPKQAQLSELQAAVDAVKARGYQLGFVLMDVKTGKGVAYNPDTTFYGASAIKGPYIAAVCERYPEAIDSHAHDIGEVLTYSWDYNYFNLRNDYGIPVMREYLSSAGVDPSLAELNFPSLTPRDFLKMWLRTYIFFEGSDAGKRVAPRYGAPTVSLIRASIGGVAGYTTRSKAGYVAWPGYDAMNDCGIVYSPKGTYVVAIESNGAAQSWLLAPVASALNNLYTQI